MWDSDKNRWVNLNSDEDDSVSAIPPPPKASDLAGENIPKLSPGVVPSNSNTSFNSHLGRNDNSMVDYVESAGVGGAAGAGAGAVATAATTTTTTPAGNLPPTGPNKYKMTRGKSKCRRTKNFFCLRLRVSMRQTETNKRQFLLLLFFFSFFQGLKSNYVDVLSKGSATTPSPAVAPPDLFPTMNYSSQIPTNYFIPAPGKQP